MGNVLDLKTLQETPPWEWPKSAGKTFLKTLTDPGASESDRLIAANLAGDCVVINDALANALMTVVGNAKESDILRAKAAIAFGPVLELADIDGFEEPEFAPPITEATFHKIQELLHDVFFDGNNPKLVRRRVLEASVRSEEPWHQEAVSQAYASGDEEWKLTAVFAMRYVKGSDDQILEALKSSDEKIHFEAVEAAGNWAVDAAWPHIVELIEDPDTPKLLLLAAIEAAGSIRPAEAQTLLVELTESDDEEIAEAADEAISMAAASLDDDDDEDDEEEAEEDDDWVN